MGTHLNIKLLLPVVVVGGVSLLTLLLLADDNLSLATVLSIFVLIFMIQAIASYFFSQHLLTGRLEKLATYLKLVINIEHAPERPKFDPHNDELAVITNELSEFIANLSDVMAEIRTESEELREGSLQLSSKMADSMTAVDGSAHQIEQMAGSIEEVATTSQILSASALQVSDTAGQAMSLITQGTESSATNQHTIESCAKEVDDMANELALLQKECSGIGSVLDVIRGIAEQTNLLALNAAIEAARAGDQGRGFAVVAGEVRALAHRTQESTVEIQSMVEGLQAKSQNAVNSIARGQSLSKQSLTYSHEVVSALTKIGDVFHEVDELTSQIASGTNEQQQATNSINENMVTIVTLSRDINTGLTSVNAHTEQQKQTVVAVDTTLNRICV